jgi:glycerophosphoryl diester phosphodiesterase
VTVMSFSEVALRRVRRLAPGVPLVILMERVPVAYRSGMLPKGVRISGPGLPIVKKHPNYVRRVRDASAGVFVWTVDDPDDVELVHGMGVDAIITNRPREVREQVDALAAAAQARSTSH